MTKLSLKVAIITVSDRASRGEYEDKSGPAAKEVLANILSEHEPTFELGIIPDEAEDLMEAMEASVHEGYDYVFTTGGTGIGPRDITPGVTKGVVDKEIPGIGEAMRSFSMGITKNAMFSCATAGIAGKSLIINLPGSPKAVREILEFLGPTLTHAYHMICGEDVH